MALHPSQSPVSSRWQSPCLAFGGPSRSSLLPGIPPLCDPPSTCAHLEVVSAAQFESEILHPWSVLCGQTKMASWFSNSLFFLERMTKLQCSIEIRLGQRHGKGNPCHCHFWAEPEEPVCALPRSFLRPHLQARVPIVGPQKPPQQIVLSTDSHWTSGDW